MASQKTNHYWAIHRRVTRREWQNLDRRSRDIIAGDTAHTSREFKEFERYVNGETERLYNDEGYYYNDPYSFKYHPFEDRLSA
jgi:hypothetical protein